MTSRAGKPNAAVDGYFQTAKKRRVELERLREIILSSGLNEELKWDKPCYTWQGANVVILASFKEYCALIFCKGALLKDPHQVLVKPGENTQAARQMRFTEIAEIRNSESTLRTCLKDAIAVERAGLEVTYKETKDFAAPPEWEEKLAASPALKAAFAALTPGRQRGYLIYFSAAKQAKTRASRIEKCVPRILARQGLNDE